MTNPSRGVLSFLSGAARGYLRLGRAIGRGLAFIGFVLAASAAVVAPAWLLASRYPVVFTAGALALLGAAALFLLALRLRRETRSAGGAGAWARRRLVPALGRLAFLLFSLAALYGLALLYAAGLYAAAVPLTIAYAVLLGRRAFRAARRTRTAKTPLAADDRSDGTPE
jgi:hypothetical protein